MSVKKLSPDLSPEEQYNILSRGSVDLISKTELLDKLKLKRPLRVKAGFDPSRPDLHLGHSILINKLRQFQELGHEVHFIVGDWTARIGDPSGQNKLRPILSEKQVKQQAETYIQQVTAPSGQNQSRKPDQEESLLQKMINNFAERFRNALEKKNLKQNSAWLDEEQRKLEKLYGTLQRLDGGKIKKFYNSEWLDKISLRDFIISISSKITVNQILNREDFKKRYETGTPLYLHEFLYPLFQAYDSVKIKADVELGGTDQLFNLLLGRDLQDKLDQEPQCVLTLPLLEGLDGKQKMSKSLNNFIAFNDSPKNMYGKVMKVSDELMQRYWNLFAEMEGTQEAKKSDTQNQEKGQGNLKREKELLAFGIVASFYNEGQACQVKEEFDRVFSNKGLPDQIPEKIMSPANSLWICQLIKNAGLCETTSSARRAIQSGAIRKDKNKLSDPQEKLNLESGDEFLLSFGRRKFVKVKVK